MSRRSPILEKESRPSFSRATRMALSYLALFPFHRLCALSDQSHRHDRVRPGDQLLSSSLALIPRGATLANFHTLLFETPFLRWLGNSSLIALAVTITGVALASTAGYAPFAFSFHRAQLDPHRSPCDPDVSGHDAAPAALRLS